MVQVINNSSSLYIKLLILSDTWPHMHYFRRLCFVAYINSGNKLQTAVRLLPHDDDNCAYFGSSVAATVIRDSADSDLVVVGSYGHYNNGHFENSG